MICFEVRVNGKVVCTAGVGDLGVLTAILTWVKREPSDCPEGLETTEWSEQQLDLNIGGSIGHGKHGHEFLDWIDHQGMSVGDEVAIRILDQPHCDPPSAKRIDTSEFVQESKRQYLAKLKKEFADNSEEGDKQ